MRKHLKLIIVAACLVAVVVVLHFVPIDSRTGHLFGVKCTGQNYTYRWIKSGQLNAWDDQLSHLDEGNQFPKKDCAQTVHVRLYAF